MPEPKTHIAMQVKYNIQQNLYITTYIDSFHASPYKILVHNCKAIHIQMTDNNHNNIQNINKTELIFLTTQSSLSRIVNKCLSKRSIDEMSTNNQTIHCHR